MFHLLERHAQSLRLKARVLTLPDGDNKKYDVVRVLKDYASADVKPLIASAAKDKTWAVIDLRPFRPLITNRKLEKIDKGLEELIWGYDAVLVIPEIHAATLY